MATAQHVEHRSALYPPTITPPSNPLPLHQFVWKFLRNPLLALPQQAYEQPIVRYTSPLGVTVVWVTDPVLTEKILQNKPQMLVLTQQKNH